MAIKFTTEKKKDGKYTAEDMAPHDTVAAIFTKGTGKNMKLWVQWHNKHTMLTCPIGKVKHDQSITEGLIAECKEETGATIKEYVEILSYKNKYSFTGKLVPVTTHVFKVVKYVGELKNAEPHKHKWSRWLTREDIKSYNMKTSDALVAYFKWLDEVNQASILKPNVTVGKGK